MKLTVTTAGQLFLLLFAFSALLVLHLLMITQICLLIMDEPPLPFNHYHRPLKLAQ